MRKAEKGAACSLRNRLRPDGTCDDRGWGRGARRAHLGRASPLPSAIPSLLSDTRAHCWPFHPHGLRSPGGLVFSYSQVGKQAWREGPAPPRSYTQPQGGGPLQGCSCLPAGQQGRGKGTKPQLAPTSSLLPLPQRKPIPEQPSLASLGWVTGRAGTIWHLAIMPPDKHVQKGGGRQQVAEREGGLGHGSHLSNPGLPFLTLSSKQSHSL